MASSHWSNSPAKSIHFFKIVLADIGSHSKLMIPEKFVKKIGKNLDNRIQLSAPSGSVWSIDLGKHRGEVWLQNGWPEFAKFYSIRFGYLLVFEYQGDSEFQVHIFDQSAVEIDYPLTRSADDGFVKKKENGIHDATHSEARKRTRANSARVGKATVNGKKKNSALILAKAFKSENPFLILSVQPSHLNGRSPAHITVAFREVYTKWMNNVQVILKVGRRSWPVYSHLKWERCLFRGGWARFAGDNSLNVEKSRGMVCVHLTLPRPCSVRDLLGMFGLVWFNSLNVGDACVFELINPATKLFKVFIFRAAAESP